MPVESDWCSVAHPSRAAICIDASALLNLKSSVSKGEGFRLMNRCQARSRRCKMPYSSAEAAALAFSDWT
jgi:hypothetical protein